MQIRTRYDEVDKMGYVYHANHVKYCHQARTELMRKAGISDQQLEACNIILPVISFSIDYKIPVLYDELITINTTARKKPGIRFKLEFELRNEKGQLTSKASSTIVFADKNTGKPIKTPGIVLNAFENFK